VSGTTLLLVLFSAILHASWNLVTKKHAGNYSIIYLSFVGGAIYTAYPGLANWPADNSVFMGNLWLIVLACFAHAIYGYVLSYTYRYGDISTLYPIVRGSGVAIAVFVSIIFINEPWNLALALGASGVIAGIALLSYKRNRKKTRLLGIALALVCGSLIATYTVVDKVIVEKMHPMSFLFILQVTSCLIFLPLVLTKRRTELVETVKKSWKSVLYVSMAATGSYSIILYVFTHTDVSRVATVRESAVVFGAIGGYWLFKESFSWIRLIGVLLVAAGIIFVKLS
jgi:drug/metabolite transporter (DMT)-like permease